MDKSLYERHNNTRQSQQTGIAFGRITKVYPEKRLCEVKTFMGTGQQDDNAIPYCQWINMDAHPDGDESTNIPRVNSYGLVFFVGGEPFIFGFFSPLTGTGSASVQTDDKEELNEGDRVLKTVGRNKIILRAHGEIQIQSTDTCRTLYFPDRHIINTLCRNYEFATDGGTINWENVEDSGDTLYRAEYRDNIERTNVIIEERGLVDEEIISRTVIGPGSDSGVALPVWSRTIKNTGETELFIRVSGASTGHKLTITPDGTTKVEIGGKASLEIKSSGETTMDVGPGNAVLNIKPTGETTFTTQDKVNVTAKGAVALTTESTLNVKTSGKTAFDVGGDFSVKASGKGTFKANQIDIDGGGNLEQVLTTPNTVSQFTGLPLAPGSNTVKASI